MHTHTFTKLLNPLLSVLALVLIGFPLSAQQYHAVLSGNQEVPVVTSMAHGEVMGRVSNGDLILWGSFDMLSDEVDTTIAGGAHIHLGLAGQNGGVAFPINLTLDTDLMGGTIDSANNRFSLTANQLTALEGRALYVNLHTKAYSGGELRGQLLPGSDAVYHALARGSNATHRVISNGHGAILLELHDTTLVVSGSFNDLEGDFNEAVAGGIHLHGALPGENGGIGLSLQTTLDPDLRGGILIPDSNTFQIPSNAIVALKNNGWYLNIHTQASAAGELRGQVLPIHQATFRVFLSGLNQNPSIQSSGHGQLIFAYKDDSLVVSGHFDDLSSMADTTIAGGAHIHLGLPGRNGGVVHPLNVNYDTDLMGGDILPSENAFGLRAVDISSLFNRELYVNIHTQQHGSGELRGQILPMANYYFSAYLTGSQEVHDVVSRGDAKLQLEVNGSMLTTSGSFSRLSSALDTSILGGVHIHQAATGENGGVVVPLNSTNESDLLSGRFMPSNNQIEMSEGLLDTMAMRWHYANIHTANYGAGELRGQIIPEANRLLHAKLSGAAQLTPVNTGGHGAVLVDYHSGINSFYVSGSFQGLSSEVDETIAGGAHLHNAEVASNGGIWHRLTSVLESDKLSGYFMAADNNWTLNSNASDTLFNRMNYLNIHTTNHGSGELRGQVVPISKAYYSANMGAMNVVQPIPSNAGGKIQAELHGSKLVIYGGFDMLDSEIDTTIAGGAHLHVGYAGENGSLSEVLVLDLHNDIFGADVLAEENEIELSQLQMKALEEGLIYVNVHTRDHRAGALRGQFLRRTNFFPSADANIISPSNGVSLTVEGDPSQLLQAEWNEANDRDSLAYIWQLAVDSDFDTVLINVNVGAALTANLTYGFVDTLLSENGLGQGDSIMLYHRAIATDGGLSNPGEANAITLTRGTFIGLENKILESHSMSLYPNPANQQLNVLLKSSSIEGERVNLTVYNTLGKRLDSREFTATGRSMVQFNTGNLQPGQYIIRLQMNGVREHAHFNIVR